MNKEQCKILEKEFKANPVWSKFKLNQISKKIGRDKDKVYKWLWERKKKLNKKNKRKRRNSQKK